MKIAIVATSLLLATAMPATAGHYGGGDSKGGDCISVKPRPEPMPTDDGQLNKQGINGLILIAGIAVALLIAFRRKPPPFQPLDIEITIPGEQP